MEDSIKRHLKGRAHHAGRRSALHTGLLSELASSELKKTGLFFFLFISNPTPKPTPGVLLMDLALFRNIGITFEQVTKYSVALCDFPFSIKSLRNVKKKLYCQAKSIAIESFTTTSSFGAELGHQVYPWHPN